MIVTAHRRRSQWVGSRDQDGVGEMLAMVTASVGRPRASPVAGMSRGPGSRYDRLDVVLREERDPCGVRAGSPDAVDNEGGSVVLSTAWMVRI